MFCRNSLRLFMKDSYFLYVGNAYPHKNVQLLIRAAREAHARVIYVGKNDYFYKKLGVVPRTVSDTELTRLYKNAEALVFPSLMEGFGLPAIEALRQGCPVIVSDIPVFHELLGESAIYVDPHDSHELARILASEIDKPKKLTKTYSWSKMARETLSIYEACNRVRSGK